MSLRTIMTETSHKRWHSPMFAALLVVGWLLVSLTATSPAPSSFLNLAASLKANDSIDATGTRIDPPRLQQTGNSDHPRDPDSVGDDCLNPPHFAALCADGAYAPPVALYGVHSWMRLAHTHGPRAPPV